MATDVGLSDTIATMPHVMRFLARYFYQFHQAIEADEFELLSQNHLMVVDILFSLPSEFMRDAMVMAGDWCRDFGRLFAGFSTFVQHEETRNFMNNVFMKISSGLRRVDVHPAWRPVWSIVTGYFVGRVPFMLSDTIRNDELATMKLVLQVAKQWKVVIQESETLMSELIDGSMQFFLTCQGHVEDPERRTILFDIGVVLLRNILALCRKPYVLTDLQQVNMSLVCYFVLWVVIELETTKYEIERHVMRHSFSGRQKTPNCIFVGDPEHGDFCEDPKYQWFVDAVESWSQHDDDTWFDDRALTVNGSNQHSLHEFLQE